MDEMIRKVLTDERLVINRENWFQKMRDLYDGKRTEKIYLTGTPAWAPDVEDADPEVWMEEVLRDLALRAYDSISEQCFVPLGIDLTNYGNHLLDKIFGAEVIFRDGMWFNRRLKTAVGKLEKPDLGKSKEWRQLIRLAEAFLAAEVTVPLLGTPIIASPLNIAVNLYGEEILVAMLTEPEAAHHDLQLISEVQIEMHRWYCEHIPMNQLQGHGANLRVQPPGYGQICGCSTQLLSAELYEEFILPLDNAILGVYPGGGMIHLCGSHRQLIPLFARMENLKCVQLNDRAAEDLEYYVKGLREDQVIYYYFPCEGMPLERALEIAKDKRMILTCKP